MILSGAICLPKGEPPLPLYRTRDLFDLSKTIAAALFEKTEWPWEALAGIHDFILGLGPALPAERFDHPAPDVWIAKDARVAPSASISGPCIIDEGAEVRHCAFIRADAIVGKGAVVGNSTELKNVVLFDGVQAPHYNYVGDSVLGHKAHLGAGAITSNLKSDKTPVAVHSGAETVDTGRKKVGAMVGDFCEVGCNSVLNPGAVLGRGSMVYPTSCVRGVLPENGILKTGGAVVIRE